MTEIDINNIDPDDPLMAESRKLVAENKAQHVKHEITLVGGAADGQTFEIPDGVNNLSVEVNDVSYTYLRSAKALNEFVLHGA